MKRFLILSAILCASLNASANEPTEKAQTIKVFCGVNTYNDDGSDFKGLFANTVELELEKMTEIFRTSDAVYSVISEKNEIEKTSYSSLFVEIAQPQTGTTISAANTEWVTGAPGMHQLSAYSSVAEKSRKTMIWCSVQK